MIPRDPGKRIRIRRCLFATQFAFLVTKILVSVLVTGDFISLMIQSFAFLVFFSYVPWALVCDFRTAKEVRLEWERMRRIRRGEETAVGETSVLEHKGRKNRWRSDRAWQECLFLVLQGLCWLLSAVFAGIQGGPAACQEAVLQGAIISGLDNLVPDRAATQFCDGMTANIALSCIGVVFTALWLWWVYYSVKTLRKFEKTTKADGEEVLIVREKVWRKSMARLLRRDEDDDVNGIKRIATGGLVDLIEMESRRSIHRRGSAHAAYTHRSASGTNGTAGVDTGIGMIEVGPGFGLGPSTPRPSHESNRSSNADGTAPDTSLPGFGERRDTEAILQSLPRTRGDMPPPPYIGQSLAQAPQDTGTNTQTLSSSGEGTNTSMTLSHESPDSRQALLGTSSGSGSAQQSTRPLPLAPPEVERVVDRKMDQMASATGTATGTMDAFTATRLGLGPAARLSTDDKRGSSGTGSGVPLPHRMEDLVDQKLDTYQAASAPAVAGPSSAGAGRFETMEHLVDRKIALSSDDQRSASASGSAPSPTMPEHRYAAEMTASPTRMDYEGMTSTWPGSNPPPHFESLSSALPLSPSSSGSANGRGKGKAAEAGFTIDDPPPLPGNTTSQPDEMTLEEMIERKMAAMRADAQAKMKGQEPDRPHPITSNSGGGASTRNKGKGRRKTGRRRAGSDPGPKLQSHDETDEGESGEG